MSLNGGLFERNRKLGFRRAVVIHEYNSCMGTDGELADKAIMSIDVTEDPATSVEMHYDRHQAFAVFRANDAHTDSTFGADRKRRVLDMCIGLRVRD
jgi:hypothetical protein